MLGAQRPRVHYLPSCPRWCATCRLRCSPIPLTRPCSFTSDNPMRCLATLKSALSMLLMASVGGVALVACAQDTGRIVGRILDCSTQEPLFRATVHLAEKQTIGGLTDRNGRYYLLKVPPGRYTVVMSSSGSTPKHHEHIAVHSGRETKLDGCLHKKAAQSMAASMASRELMPARPTEYPCPNPDQDEHTISGMNGAAVRNSVLLRSSSGCGP